MAVTSIDKQTLLDIAIQETGSVESVFALALSNGIGITDDLQPGSVLKIPDGNVDDTALLEYLKSNNVRPASADLVQSTPVGPQGINYWAIEKDFKVS